MSFSGYSGIVCTSVVDHVLVQTLLPPGGRTFTTHKYEPRDAGSCTSFHFGDWFVRPSYHAQYYEFIVLCADCSALQLRKHGQE